MHRFQLCDPQLFPPKPSGISMSENQDLSSGLLEGATSFPARFTGSSVARQEHIDPSVGTESIEGVEERE
ncbi:hypothetical protein K0M31_015883 [Melipona bicolor]|uniref:Uncharacterized protein n=1 Tax=Melipona bicolor TaxID=60889 RepID=A0AA40G6D7_9HYME|nr:hypothetical protein K0M31_015883 [Melipona bicolor]